MGFLEDLEKALNDFDEWLTEYEYEESEWDEPERPLESFEIVDDDFFAPVADFFENLDKGTDEIVTDFVGELLGKETKDEVAEEWYAYYWTYEGGYWGTDWYSEDSGIYYSREPDMEEEVMQRIYEEYGDRYFGGQGFEISPSVDEGYSVDADEVNKDDEL